MHFPKSKIHKELGHCPDAGYPKMAKVELRIDSNLLWIFAKRMETQGPENKGGGLLLRFAKINTLRSSGPFDPFT